MITVNYLAMCASATVVIFFAGIILAIMEKRIGFIVIMDLILSLINAVFLGLALAGFLYQQGVIVWELS